jgi:predicted phosphodiesterase
MQEMRRGLKLNHVLGQESGRQTRREFLREMAFGAAVMVGGISCTRMAAAQSQMSAPGFRFVQLSDTHIGYEGDANRDVPGTLKRALAAVERLLPRPEFVVVTGDLTQPAGTDALRAQRLRQFRAITETLHVPVYTVPGEHDALLDHGRVYQKIMGPLHYRFHHKGVQFFALDNVSRGFLVGDVQRRWLASELQAADPMAPTVILAHAPLYDAFVPWNWYTYDGAAVLDLFKGFRQLTVLFGHVHQDLSRQNPAVRQWGSLSTAWPLPEPDALGRLEKWPQSASDPYMGLGLRVLDVQTPGALAAANHFLSPPAVSGAES